MGSFQGVRKVNGCERNGTWPGRLRSDASPPRLVA